MSREIPYTRSQEIPHTGSREVPFAGKNMIFFIVMFLLAACANSQNLVPSTGTVPFSIQFAGQAWGMAKSTDNGATWTPIATIDMHTYQHSHMIGEVRDVAVEGMIIKFQPLHQQLANDLGFLCPIMHDKCDGTCTYDANRNNCFNWDHSRIFLHEMKIDGQVQDFSSLTVMESNGWDFQCRTNPDTCTPSVQVQDYNGRDMVVQHGANWYYTYTFNGIGGTGCPAETFCDADGFQLAMQFSSNSIFKFDSNYWTDETLLGTSGEGISNKDGKYKAFTQVRATEIKICAVSCVTLTIPASHSGQTLKEIFSSVPSGPTGLEFDSSKIEEFRAAFGAPASGYPYRKLKLNFDDTDSSYQCKGRLALIQNNEGNHVTANDAIGLGAQEANGNGAGAAITIWPSHSTSLQAQLYVKGVVDPLICTTGGSFGDGNNLEIDADITPPFTISASITFTQGGGGILGFGTAWGSFNREFRVSSGGLEYGQVNGGWSYVIGQPGTSFQKNQKYDVAVVRLADNSVYLYVDGVEVAQGTLAADDPGTANLGSSIAKSCRTSHGCDNDFVGKIENLKIYETDMRSSISSLSTPCVPGVSTESPTAQPTLSPTMNPTKSPTMNPTKSPTMNPTNLPTVEDFIIKVKGFHGQKEDVLNKNKIQSQPDVDIDVYGFERKITPLSRRHLKDEEFLG